MTKKILGMFLLAAFCLVNVQISAQQYAQRKSITLPADAKAILLAQMLGHVIGLDDVVTALGEGNYKVAAEIASTELGTPRFQDAEGQSPDQGPGLGVGQYLPQKFRAMSWRFRKAANEFAELASRMPDSPSAEQQQALIVALGGITNQCRICHDAYRID
jgi:cytochrome c556